MTPRVLLCGRPNLLTKPGGDTRQILGLQRLLGDARLSLALRPPLEDVDLVHVFNLSRPVEPAIQAQRARQAGVPVVCTPIYQDLWEYNRRGRRGAGRTLFHLLGGSDARLEELRASFNLVRSGPAGLAGLPLLARAVMSDLMPTRPAVDLQRQVLENSQVVLFNSAFEADTVRTCVGMQSPSFEARIVPVGIDPEEILAVGPGPFCRRFGLQPGFVLAVGRLEDLKNQLSLIHALEGEPGQLVLIGRTNPLHRGYARAVRKAAARRPRTLLLQRVERLLVLSAMAAAAVHVLPSWFETAGLTSLEAAVAGCAVVTTSRGYATAYLGAEAHYCDPGDLASIREAVRRALAAGPSTTLRRRILEQFTESVAAAETARVYRQVAA